MYFLVVIDSFGIGSDGSDDIGAATAHSAARAAKGSKWRFLSELGLGNACLLTSSEAPDGCAPAIKPIASYGAMRKRALGKDTQTGHWELAGMDVSISLRIMPQEYPSFDESIMNELREATGYDYIGNYAASGTAIINELGEEHIKSGKPIIYTSADSVMQIAAHTDVISLDELYEICRKARIVADKCGIGRVIARPYTTTPEKGFTRTKDRRDFGIELPSQTLLTTEFTRLGIKTVGVGKIGDIFNEEGIDISYHDKGNDECLKRLTRIVSDERSDLTSSGEDIFVFVNLVDTDMLYGHRRDAVGYCNEIERISRYLEGFCGLMKVGDVLYVTADHGCDPSYKGTDHTREFVPLFVYDKGGANGDNLGIIEGFDYCVQDIARRVAAKRQ